METFYPHYCCKEVMHPIVINSVDTGVFQCKECGTVINVVKEDGEIYKMYKHQTGNIMCLLSLWRAGEEEWERVR
jgi:uncharacterized Zn finger protein